MILQVRRNSKGDNAINFKVGWSSLPDYLPGRFIVLNSSWGEFLMNQKKQDSNPTRIQIGELGSISGTVTYNGYRADPIVIQACTDPHEPDSTVIASTIIQQPGPYTLNGIGLGWKGCVRAITPLLGFGNPFELTAFDIESAVPVTLWEQNTQGIDIDLTNPIVLQNDIAEFGALDSNDTFWYAFDAVQGGTYTLDLIRLTSVYAGITLYDRDGDTVLRKLYDWDTQQIILTCQAGGRYYVKVKNYYYQSDIGTYQITMTSDITCPQTDIASDQWIGVKDCKVDIYDLRAVILQWLNSCSQPYNCDQADFNTSGSVDFVDFATLAEQWMTDGF